MPLYDYKCLSCGKTIHARHSMKEKPSLCSEVTECKEGSSIEKLISLKLETTSGKADKFVQVSDKTSTNNSKNQEQLAESVERHIEHLRHEAKETKAELKEKTKSMSVAQALNIAKGKS